MTPEAQGAVERAAEVLRERGETEGLMWGSLDLSDETYTALARALATANLLAPPTASHDETAALTEAVEAEWFNGNIAEDVRDRLLLAARAAAGADMAGESRGTS